MELTIQTDNGAGTNLYRWLLEDPEAAAYASGATPAAMDPAGGEMGIGFDVLNLVIPNVIALSSLVVSIATYRLQAQQSTGTAPSVSVSQAGVVVVVEGDGSEAVRQLTQAVGSSQASSGVTPTAP
ncbi:hypothetical protein ABZ580_11045 [Streptomyces sp. NPDC012486]|uniref:effector-associated constant component EACC1 n=1 Tax=Streptomyces TaxID=1883 RepID=UPI001C5E1F3A|nr:MULTISPECIES: hypothetical protein [Streptomyces]MBW5250440.1 hypothetical protein [Streptomyces poriferorum]MBW5256283.1 hypothetical protein [Streptomyces poriferorum]MDX2622395.1 hypothetical protein [Streptomyces sp. WI03-5b]